MSEGLRYIPACVPEATCEPASTAYTGSSQRLATSATVKELESHGNMRSITVRAAACRTCWNGASVEAGSTASTALQYFRRELFLLGVTAEALRINISSKSTISLQRVPADPKFQVEGVAPT